MNVIITPGQTVEIKPHRLANRLALIVLIAVGFAAPAARADSIWIYTFSDQLGVDPSTPVGFSFSVPQPLQIAANDTFVVQAANLDTCVVPAGGVCQFAQLWWQAPGDLRVLFEYGPYPTATDNADFQISSLGDEGIYGYRITELATFTIHDPVVTPEPPSGLLLGVGLCLASLALIARRRNRHPSKAL
jgi:hypothetical protein